MAVASVYPNVMDWQLAKESILDRLETLLKTSQWSDCSFRVEGQSHVQIFKAHRLILACCSPVFEAMCFGPLAENKCIDVPDIEPDVFRVLLEYMYTDTVKFTSVEEAGGILYASKKYMLPHLSKSCCEYLSSMLRPSNVLSLFEFAEEVQEDKLMDACIKVMRKHTEEILRSPGCHISAFTLRTLLEQTALNINEAQLFDAVLCWAKTECEQLGLAQTAENQRAVLLKAGALSKIRFLCLSPQEFMEGPERSGVLAPDEIFSLQYALADTHNGNSSEKGKPKSKEHLTSLVNLPAGWSTLSQPRKQITIHQFYCARHFLKTALTVSGYLRLLTKIQVDKSVMVTGIRVFTRLIPRGYIYKLPMQYKENLQVSVLNEQGTILWSAVFSEKVEYNTLATINFGGSVRFNSKEEYSIHIVLPSSSMGLLHEYPLSFMSQTENTRGIKFQFCDYADIDHSGNFVCRLDMGFVDAIVYSL